MHVRVLLSRTTKNSTCAHASTHKEVPKRSDNGDVKVAWIDREPAVMVPLFQ